LSPEIVALLVLLLGVVAAVAFTLIVVATVDRSAASTRPTTGDDGAREQENEKR
jgi:hypothetical protein